jgi:hypothetical protein
MQCKHWPTTRSFVQLTGKPRISASHNCFKQTTVLISTPRFIKVWCKPPGVVHEPAPMTSADDHGAPTH